MGNSTHTTVTEELAVSSTGTIHVPARFQAHHVGSCYNQEVSVTVDTPDGPTESIEFTGFVTAASSLTIPSEIREFANIEAGEDTVSVEMEPTGNSWSPEDGGRTDYTGQSDDLPGAISDEELGDEFKEELPEETEDEAESILDEMESEFEELEDEAESEESEEDEPGLGELFG